MELGFNLGKKRPFLHAKAKLARQSPRTFSQEILVSSNGGNNQGLKRKLTLRDKTARLSFNFNATFLSLKL